MTATKGHVLGIAEAYRANLPIQERGFIKVVWKVQGKAKPEQWDSQGSSPAYHRKSSTEEK